MELIEKITIKHYRSLVNTKDEIINLSNLNIFSWSNDSWKSNILRALNIFFNWETDNLLYFNSDFSIQELEREEKEREKNPNYSIHKNIDITLYFDIRSTTYRTQKFAVTKRFSEEWFVKRIDHIFKPNKKDYSYTKDFENATKLFEKITWEKSKKWEKNTFKIDLSSDDDKLGKTSKLVRTSITRSLNKMRFYYIPAIKDNNIFSKLYSEVLSKIKENDDIFSDDWKKKISDSIITLEQNINHESNNLFKNLSFLQSTFKIPDKLEDFFSTFDIWTQRDNEYKSISLRNRWDWLQARYIPELLNFISEIENKDTRIKKNYFRGFEEPENSYEYSQAQILAEKFKNTYSKDKQIFITSHSFNFLSLDGDNVSKYRVYKDEKQTSRIFNLKDIDKMDHKDLLNNEIWLYKLNEDLEKVYIQKENEKKELEAKKAELETKINNLPNPLPTKIFICEDSSAETIGLWANLFTKYWINNVEIIPSSWCSNNIVEWFIETSIKRNNWYSPTIFRQIDRDGLYDEQRTKLEEKMNTKYWSLWRKYVFKTLSVNEIENFAVIQDNSFTEEIFTQNQQNIEDTFEKIIETKCKQLHRFFDYQEVNLFDNSATIRQQMRNYARTNWKKFFPGKDLWKLIPNYNPIIYLNTLDLTSYPAELTEYLSDIKTFFSV